MHILFSSPLPGGAVTFPLLLEILKLVVLSWCMRQGYNTESSAARLLFQKKMWSCWLCLSSYSRVHLGVIFLCLGIFLYTFLLHLLLHSWIYYLCYLRSQFYMSSGLPFCNWVNCLFLWDIQCQPALSALSSHSCGPLLFIPTFQGLFCSSRPAFFYTVVLQQVTAKLREQILQADQDQFRQSRTDLPQSRGFCKLTANLMVCFLEW